MELAYCVQEYIKDFHKHGVSIDIWQTVKYWLLQWKNTCSNFFYAPLVHVVYSYNGAKNLFFFTLIKKSINISDIDMIYKL